jgi:hypothetical protein
MDQVWDYTIQEVTKTYSATIVKVSGALVDITPSVPLQLAGYASRNRAYEFIFSRLEADVLLFFGEHSTVALIGVDTLYAGRALRDAVIALLQETPAMNCDIHMVATHTHFAPSLDPFKPKLGAIDSDYFKFCASQIAEAVIQATATQANDVDLVRGQKQCEGSIYRRKYVWKVTRSAPFFRRSMEVIPNNEVSIPNDLIIYLARTSNGKPAFALWSWPCHAVANPNLYSVSADFPGAVRNAIREFLGSPDLPIVYAPGFCGDIRPNTTTRMPFSRSFFHFPFVERFVPYSARTYSRLLENISSAAIKALEQACAVTTEQHVYSTTVSLPVSNVSTFNSHYGIGVSLIASGDFGILGIGAEVCSQYHSKIAKLLPSGFILSGHFGEVFGYLPTDSQIDQGGYEVTDFSEFFSLHGRFKEKIEQTVYSHVLDVISKHGLSSV